MSWSHTTEFKFDNGVYFAAHTNNGGYRVGMNGMCAIEFPADHPQRAEAESVTLRNVEDFIDAQVAKGNIRF